MYLAGHRALGTEDLMVEVPAPVKLMSTTRATTPPTKGKWPRFGLFDKQWLVLDDEGNVVVAASSRMLRKHTLVRIRLDGPSRHVDRVYLGRGVLAMSPWVDASGYALPISQKAGKLPKVVRLETLSGRNGTWGDMGGCL